ncbi:uncharacterized protein LOC136087334 isoform X2 [Hydra vulgaris]
MPVLGTKESYAKARSELNKATVTSDLQSDVDDSRLRKKRIQKYPDDGINNSAEDSDTDSQTSSTKFYEDSSKQKKILNKNILFSKTNSHMPPPQVPKFPVISQNSLPLPFVNQKVVTEPV